MDVPRLRRTVAFTPIATRWSRKSSDSFRGRAEDGIAGRRVEGDEVDVGAQRPGVRRQLLGVPGSIVHVVDERPLERQPPTLRLEVVATGVGQRREGIAAVDGDELVAEVVVGRVQGHGEVHGQGLRRQAADAGDDADGRDGEVAGGQPDVVVEAGDGGPDGVVVGHGFTHPHEHHVGQAPSGRGRGRAGPHYLLHDLAGAQLPIEAGLTGGAEAAGHRASRLRGDADGGSAGVVHEHRLDLAPVVEGPQPLDRVASLGHRFVRHLERRPEARVAVQHGAEPLGQDGERTGVDAVQVEPLPDLGRSVGRLTVVGQQARQLGPREVVAAGHPSSVRGPEPSALSCG